MSVVYNTTQPRHYAGAVYLYPVCPVVLSASSATLTAFHRLSGVRLSGRRLLSFHTLWCLSFHTLLPHRLASLRCLLSFHTLWCLSFHTLLSYRLAALRCLLSFHALRRLSFHTLLSHRFAALRHLSRFGMRLRGNLWCTLRSFHTLWPVLLRRALHLCIGVATLGAVPALGPSLATPGVIRGIGPHFGTTANTTHITAGRAVAAFGRPCVLRAGITSALYGGSVHVNVITPHGCALRPRCVIDVIHPYLLVGTAFKLAAARTIYICVTIVYVGIVDDGGIVDNGGVIPRPAIVIMKAGIVQIPVGYKHPPIVGHTVSGPERHIDTDAGA